MSLVSHAIPVESPHVPSDPETCTSLPSARRGDFQVELALRHSGTRRVTVRFETIGDARLPAVIVAGGISAHRHAAANTADPSAGWWETQVGIDAAIDPLQHHVIAIDWLGARGELDCVIDPADQAAAFAALLDHLCIGRVHAFVGSSYGAMVGLQFAAKYPARIERLVAISGTHRAHPYSSAWRALQRRAVELGSLQCDAIDGVALARQLALLSYRTPEEFDERFATAQVVDGRVRVAAEDYLDHCGQAYAQRTSPTAFLRLSESIDLQQVAPETISAAVTLVAVEEDRLVPVTDAYALAQRLRGETRLRVLRSRYGHDAFLKEPGAIAAVLREALDAEVAA